MVFLVLRLLYLHLISPKRLEQRERERERERDYTYPAPRLIQVLPGHPLVGDPKR